MSTDQQESNPDDFDTIVLGTGLAESIIAA
jgi:RAB protein geranylgeranyltransferase component A